MKKLLLSKLIQDNKKMALGILAALIIIYLDYSFIVTRQMQGNKKTGLEITKLQKDLDKLQKDLGKMQELKNKQAQVNTEFSRAKRIVSEEQSALLLQSISDIANKNNVKIMQMKPFKGPQSKTQPQAQAKTLATEKFTPFYVGLDLYCDYHRLGKLINDLENSQFFMGVQELKIAAQASDVLQQKVNLLLKTYVGQ